jgi:YbbR domain-containing protein
MAIPAFRNVGLKAVSIALAAALWLVVSGEQIVERVLRIPLEFMNLPEQLEIVGSPPTVVDVRVRGSSGALSRLAPGELVAVVDLSAARPGQRLFHLTGDNVRAPFGVQVVQVVPSNFSITFEPSARKTVPVVPEIEGEPAPGFEVGPVTAVPAIVEIVGPKSAVEGLRQAITEPVSVAGASGTVVETVTVGVADPAVRVATAQTARVTVSVTPARVEWAIGGVPIRLRGDGRKVAMTPREVTVHVRGPREAIGASAADFEAVVDVGQLRPGRYELPVRVTPPPRIGVVRVVPAVVRVLIK